jgi:pimeloyl-ACP methyl ester carboxylesterase
MSLHVERLGESGPRLVLVHGSASPGWATWSAQRPLADRFRLVLPIRSGYAPNPPLSSIDFEVQADELAAMLEPGDHVVAHSYGGVIALLSAARAPVQLASLTVIEPPAFGIAAGNPVVDAHIEALRSFFAEAPTRSLRDQFVGFLELVGSPARVPDELKPAIQASVRAALAERPPWEAEIPYARLRALGLPILVVSGAHHAAADAVADVLVRELGARRLVLPGAGHTVQRLGDPFNDALESFISSTTSAAHEGE